jgi:DNA repair protein SbcD/Mre11
MRLLHTSDWHIGVAHHGVDRTADHDRVFAQIKALAIEEKVDVILNTGDLFDAAYPSVETLKYGWHVLEELASIKPVVVVCGNHDGPKLFQLMGMILKERLPIHLVDLSTLQQGREKSVLRIPTAAGETLKIATVPFIKNTSYIRDYMRDPNRATVEYADGVGSLEHEVGKWLNDDYNPDTDVRVFAAHLLVDGATISGSEYELYRGRDFATDPERIPAADYVAFGHIHKPQQIGKLDYGRYAGSPIPIDFGERDDRKVVYVVSGSPGRPVQIVERELDVGRRLVDIIGTLEQIRSERERYAGTIARVVVDLEAPVAQLETQVHELLPETLVCKVTPRYPRPAGAVVVVADPGRPEPTLSELFGKFLQEHPNFGDPERLKRYFDELHDHVQYGEGDDTFTDLDDPRP